MMRFFLILVIAFTSLAPPGSAQVDTTLLFNSNTAYGLLDIRLSRHGGHFYYLEENRTFSFRSNNGAPTGTFLDMTAWDSSPYSEGHMRERNDNQDLFVMNYRILEPLNYSDALTGGYPLMIVLHGLLERGNCGGDNCYHSNRGYSPNVNDPPAPAAADHKLLNNDYNLIHAGLDYLEARNISRSMQPDDPNLQAGAFPGFVLFPQNLNGWDAPACHDVIRLIRLLVKKYNIDPDRVYVNGISHGGHGAYELLKRAPWMFAAGVLFSSADDASIVAQKMVNAISGIPLWIFQGSLDENPTRRKTENYVNAFRRAGATVRYTLYPALGHGTWNKALDEPDYFSWLLAQRRNRIHVNGGKAILCSTSDTGALLSLPKGFEDYEWEYNGSIIPGANAHTYMARQAGVYRGRFISHDQASEGFWNEWSKPLNVDASESKTPGLDQIGTVLLEDLNGYSQARLQASEEYPFYFWFKDGQYLGVLGDTLRSVTLDPALGNGAYSLRVAGFDRCKSQESHTKNVIFNNEAPIGLPAPFNLRIAAITPSEVLITWADTSRLATGFEIWRRRKDSSGSLSAWTMPVLTKPNVVSFTDKGLDPGSIYDYKIRAVSSSGRSAYVPDAAGEMEVVTPPDHEAPTPPQNLSAKQSGVKAIRLSWRASTDNSSVEQYIISVSGDSIFTNSSDTTFLLRGLELNADYSFTALAVDPSGNVSEESNPAQGNTFINGLYYEHSTGAWESVSTIDWSFAEFTGMVDDFTLGPRTQEDFFNFKFDGYLHIEKEGVYQFRLTSDDGSTLDLNDTLLIANDGIHTINTVTSPVQVLSSGPQRVTLKYFDYSLSDTLLVEYKGADSNGEWTKIPSEVLRSTLILSADEQDALDFDFTIYPNPTVYNEIHLRLKSQNDYPISIRIFDLAGNQLYSREADYDENIEIRASDHVAMGMYIISIVQGKLRVNKKIIIH